MSTNNTTVEITKAALKSEDFDFLGAVRDIAKRNGEVSKAGGMLKMVSGEPSKDSHEIKLDYKLFDANWNELTSGNGFTISGMAAGTLISLAVNTTSLYFQMGDDWDVGVRSLSYQTAVATTPIPAALPLFAGALGVLGFAARRRRKNPTT